MIVMVYCQSNFLTSFNFTRGQIVKPVENVEALPKCEVVPKTLHKVIQM